MAAILSKRRWVKTLKATEMTFILVLIYIAKIIPAGKCHLFCHSFGHADGSNTPGLRHSDDALPTENWQNQVIFVVKISFTLGTPG